MPWDSFISVVQTGGTAAVIFFMAFVGWAFYKRKIRLGSDFDDLMIEKNDWKRLALRGLTTADKATSVAEAMSGRKRRSVTDDYSDQDEVTNHG